MHKMFLTEKWSQMQATMLVRTFQGEILYTYIVSVRVKVRARL